MLSQAPQKRSCGRQGRGQAGPGGSARPAGSAYLELRLPRGKAGAGGPAPAPAPPPCRPVLCAGLGRVLRVPRLDFGFIASPRELGFLPDASPAAEQASVGAADASRDAGVAWRPPEAAPCPVSPLLGSARGRALGPRPLCLSPPLPFLSPLRVLCPLGSSHLLHAPPLSAPSHPSRSDPQPRCPVL